MKKRWHRPTRKEPNPRGHKRTVRMNDAELAAATANQERLGYPTLSDFLRSRAVSDAAGGYARNPELMRERTNALVELTGRLDNDGQATAKQLLAKWVKE